MRIGLRARFRLMIGIALLVGATSALAQNYPTKPIKLVVGFAPGGVADVTARVVAQQLADPRPAVVVDNRPTAGGIVAADSVAKAAPDGYTLLLMSTAMLSARRCSSRCPSTRSPISRRCRCSASSTSRSSPERGGDSSIRWRRCWRTPRRHPGKLDIGTINVGSTQNLAAELFKSMTGMHATIVPFKGSPAVIEALRAQ